MQGDHTRWAREGAFVEPKTQLDMTQKTEALSMEEPNRLDVSGYWPNVDELHAEAARFRDGLLRKTRTYPLSPMGRANDDWLEFRFPSFHEEPAEADHLVFDCGDPHFAETRMGEVLIELDSGIGTSNRRIAVDVAMALDKRTPEVATWFQVSRCVLTDSDSHVDHTTYGPSNQPRDTGRRRSLRRPSSMPNPTTGRLGRAVPGQLQLLLLGSALPA